MTIKIFQIDAFTKELFGGNPAAVCPLDEWLPNETMLKIAKENNLAETAFFIHDRDNIFQLKWFTPEVEIDLCGHATLASAYVILHCLNNHFDTVYFDTMSGRLVVKKHNGKLQMDLPSRPPQPSELPKIISDSLSLQPEKVLKSRDYLLVYKNEQEVSSLKVNANKLAEINLDPGGIIVTGKGDQIDFVSRFFTPGASVFEDPVTGSAHCTLTPYWAKVLNKTKMKAFQISERRGELDCELVGDRVIIYGSAVKYLEGTITI